MFRGHALYGDLAIISPTILSNEIIELRTYSLNVAPLARYVV